MKNFNKIIVFAIVSFVFIGNGCNKEEPVKNTTKTVKSKYIEKVYGRFPSTQYYLTSTDGSYLFIGSDREGSVLVSKIYEQIKEGDNVEGEWHNVIKIKEK